MSSGDSQDLKDCLCPNILALEQTLPTNKGLSKLLRATGNAGCLGSTVTLPHCALPFRDLHGGI